MFSNTQAPAINFAFPDVCKTPVGPIVVPIPYPNIAMTSSAIPNIPNQFTMAMPDHNLGTIIPISFGDNPGVLLGIISSFVMGPCRHLIGSFKVFKAVLPATKMLNITGQNGMTPNILGTTITPCQFKVLIFS